MPVSLPANFTYYPSNRALFNALVENVEKRFRVLKT